MGDSQTKIDDKKSLAISVAIVGLAGAFPLAENLAVFWQNLKKSRDCITRFSDEELLKAGVSRQELDAKNYIKSKGVIDGIENFDANFFGYSPREAALLDPQIRLAHECVYGALENAACDPERYRGLIGIYIGARNNNRWTGKIFKSGLVDGLSPIEYKTLLEKDFLAVKMAYQLNLRGPAITVDTACSTSLVAVHLACRALLTGECDLALAGGVDVQYPQTAGYSYYQGNIYSRDGQTRPFDASSSGTSFSDGAGIVALKRLSDALADGDNILAVIKGSAINNNGRAHGGFTASSIDGQAQVIKSALETSGVEPESISYIEAHGTATDLGDAVEIEALKEAFGTNAKSFCALGSVKSNIGHAGAAAGIAGLIKTVLALQHKLIPASLNFKRPNPKIDFKNSPFYVVTKPIKWKRVDKDTPLRAGISSFGVGGTNAHVILEEAPEQEPSDKGTPYVLLPLSAKTETALDKMTENLVSHLKANPDINLADVAWTLQTGRGEFAYRKALVCKNDVKEAIAGLGEAAMTIIKETATNLAQRNKATTQAKKEASLDKLAALWLQGAAIDFESKHQGEKRRKLSLPTYPFDRQRYWPEEGGSKLIKNADSPVMTQAPETDKSKQFYIPVFEENKRPAPSSGPASYLIFSDRLGLGEKLSRELKQSILVKSGKNFKKIDASHFIINPLAKADYRKLFDNIGFLPTDFLHLLSLNKESPPELNEKNIIRSLDAGFHSLIALAQALGEQKHHNSSLNIRVFTNDMHQNVKHPEQAVALGPINVIPKEYPGINCQNIDLDLNDLDQGPIIEELGSPIGDKIVLLKNGRRLTRVFKEKKPKELIGLPEKLKQEGVYLITGGLGAIGLILAEYLAKETKAKLILLSRTKPNEKQQAKIEELKKLGGRILVCSADVTSRRQMKKAIDSARERFGSIDGVIHAAGVVDFGGIIQNRKKAEQEKYLAAKVRGTIILDELLPDLDFLFLCSSMAAILAPAGEVAYVAANSFLDAFANSRPEAAISVNWGYWKGSGMAAATERKERQKTGTLKPAKIIGHHFFSQYFTDDADRDVFIGYFNPQKHWFLKEHRLFEAPTISGATWFEIVRSALSLKLKNNPGYPEFTDVQLIEPLSLANDQPEREVRIIFKKREDRLEFIAVSRPKSGQDAWQEHIRGGVRVIDAYPEPKKYDLAGLKKACRKSLEPPVKFYKKGEHFNFGPRWQSIRKVYSGKDRALIELELLPEYQEDTKGYPLHPALLDLAISLSSRYATDQYFEKGERYLPFAYEKLEAYGFLPEKIFAYAKFNGSSEDKKILRFDIVILDETGRMLIEVTDFSLKKLEPSFGPAAKIENFYLGIQTPGILDTLTFYPINRTKPNNGEVEIEIETAALNFKDVALASGLISSDKTGADRLPLGFECAGTIVRTGANVKGFRIGEKVLVHANPGFSRFVTVRSDAVHKQPANLTPEEALTALTAFFTAYYSLITLGKLKKDEKVLIHSAAGGVGLSAIQIAQWVGAEIYATAGTEEKRRYLKSLGVKHVLPSRTLDFADEIMKLTDNSGVDLVLNSLAGEFIDKGLSILAPFGRFLELGKNDIQKNTRVNLGLLEKNIAFYVIDLAQDVPGRKVITDEIIRHLEKGTLRPLPCTVFPLSEIKKAFDHMYRAKHIGKIIISFRDKKGIQKILNDLKHKAATGAILSFSDILDSLDSRPAIETEDASSITPLTGSKIFGLLVNDPLPQYIIPSDQSAGLPTVNSKDQDLTAEPAQTAPGIPSSDILIEQAITDIWQKHFGYERIGPEDNIFDLGGSSLDIISINAKMRKELGTDISTTQMFQYPTIGSLAEYLNSGQKKNGGVAKHKIDRKTQEVKEAIRLFDGKSRSRKNHDTKRRK